MHFAPTSNEPSTYRIPPPDYPNVDRDSANKSETSCDYLVTYTSSATDATIFTTTSVTAVEISPSVGSKRKIESDDSRESEEELERLRKRVKLLENKVGELERSNKNSDQICGFYKEYGRLMTLRWMDCTVPCGWIGNLFFKMCSRGLVVRERRTCMLWEKEHPDQLPPKDNPLRPIFDYAFDNLRSAVSLFTTCKSYYNAMMEIFMLTSHFGPTGSFPTSLWLKQYAKKELGPEILKTTMSRMMSDFRANGSRGRGKWAVLGVWCM
jgi:hypothetical protein